MIYGLCDSHSLFLWGMRVPPRASAISFTQYPHTDVLTPLYSTTRPIRLLLLNPSEAFENSATREICAYINLVIKMCDLVNHCLRFDISGYPIPCVNNSLSCYGVYISSYNQRRLKREQRSERGNGKEKKEDRTAVSRHDGTEMF